MAGYNQNPYTVEAGNDYSQGLSGLSNTIANVRQAKIQEAEQQRKQDQYDRAQKRFEEVQGAAQEAFASQDPDKVAQIAIKYPEVTQMLQQATGLKDDMQNRDASEFFSKFATAAPDQRQRIIENRIQMLQDAKRDPRHTQQMLEDFKANPEGETAHLMNFWAGVNPTQYSAFSNNQKAAQKAAIEQQKLDQSNNQFQQAEAGRNQRAAVNAGDRAITRQIAALTAQQAAETNALKRQELGLKIDDKIKTQQDNNTNAYSTANSAASTFDDTLANIEAIKSAPGLSGNFGKSSYIPNVRGGDSANAQALIDTLKGKAFLAAFNSLKGGGQITEVEGTKATNAMLNMENAQSEDQFRKNLEVFQGVINRGKKAAIQQRNKYSAYAPKEPQQGADAGTQAAPASSGGWEIVN